MSSKKKKEILNLDDVLENTDNKIEFEIDQFRHDTKPEPERIKVSDWFIKYSYGYIKNQAQANYIIFSLILLIVAISIYIYFDFNIGKLSSEEIKFQNMPSESI